MISKHFITQVRLRRDIDLEFDHQSKHLVKKSASIVTTWVNTPAGQLAVIPDPVVTGIVAAADAMVAPIVNNVVGVSAEGITRTQSSAGESALGDLIADAQRTYGKTAFAFMNPGGIRDDIKGGESRRVAP